MVISLFSLKFDHVQHLDSSCISQFVVAEVNFLHNSIDLKTLFDRALLAFSAISFHQSLHILGNIKVANIESQISNTCILPKCLTQATPARLRQLLVDQMERYQSLIAANLLCQSIINNIIQPWILRHRPLFTSSFARFISLSIAPQRCFLHGTRFSVFVIFHFLQGETEFFKLALSAKFRPNLNFRKIVEICEDLAGEWELWSFNGV